MITLMAEQIDEAFLLDLLNSTPIVEGVQQDELATAARARACAPSRAGLLFNCAGSSPSNASAFLACGPLGPRRVAGGDSWPAR